MKGHNVLRLNKSTIIEAVQYWIENKLIQRVNQQVKVTDINISLGMTDGDWFDVDVDGTEEEVDE